VRIAIIATGSRGDVQPYVALGKGLLEAGHAVRLVTHLNYEALVTAHGLEYWPVDADVAEIAQGAEMRELLEGGNFLSIMSHMAKQAKHGAIKLTQAALSASQGMDLLLGGMGGVFAGVSVAEKLKLPFLQAYLVPFSPTSAFPSVLLPAQLPWYPGWLNRLSHHLTRQLMWQAFRAGDASARREILGLPRGSFWGPYTSERTTACPVLYGLSPAVVPPPPDWGDGIQVTGYWFLDSNDGWAPPAELTAFLASGPTPVYVGFGSMSSRKPEETAELMLQALQRAGQRAILLSGWGGLSSADLPETVLMVDSVPHSWLFPRVAAVVHHGGVGTTAAGLRAGVPSVVIPFFGDQPFWGQRVADLGVGPSPIVRRRLTADNLAQAIRTAVTDVSMRQRAAELGATIRAEDGIRVAVEAIHSFCDQRSADGHEC
jgi:UDP:flavonoid glycosyltransferase YjiC (YdhE family)